MTRFKKIYINKIIILFFFSDHETLCKVLQNNTITLQFSLCLTLLSPAQLWSNNCFKLTSFSVKTRACKIFFGPNLWKQEISPPHSSYNEAHIKHKQTVVWTSPPKTGSAKIICPLLGSDRPHKTGGFFQHGRTSFPWFFSLSKKKSFIVVFGGLDSLWTLSWTINVVILI